MKRKIYLNILIIVMVTLFSGCWSRTEPRTMSITNSVIFNYIKETGEFQDIKQQMMTSDQVGGKGGGSEAQTFQLDICTGKTIAEAVRDETSGRALFAGNLKARFITESLAQYGLVPLMDYIVRDPFVDETSYIVVIKDKDPLRVYSSQPGLSDMAGNFIGELARTQPKIKSESVYISSRDFIKDYFSDGKHPVAGVVEIVDNQSKDIINPQGGSQGSQSTTDKEYRLNYSGLAAFKGDKLVGYMDKNETRAYNFVTNELKVAIVSLPDGVTAAKVTKSASKIKTDLKDGLPTFEVTIKVAMSVIEVWEAADTMDTKFLKELAKEFNKQIETEIAASIQKAQTEFHSDIFGFGNLFHAQHPKEWKSIKKSWDDYFSKASVNVKVTSAIVMSGQTKRSVRLEKQLHDN